MKLTLSREECDVQVPRIDRDAIGPGVKAREVEYLLPAGHDRSIGNTDRWLGLEIEKRGIEQIAEIANPKVRSVEQQKCGKKHGNCETKTTLSCRANRTEDKADRDN